MINNGFFSNLFFQEISTAFNGCLRNFKTNGELVGEPWVKVGVIPCSKRVEPGLFFYPGNGTNYYKNGECLKMFSMHFTFVVIPITLDLMQITINHMHRLLLKFQ